MICKTELSILKRRLNIEWNSNLKKYGVKLPGDGQRLYGILCLYENLGLPLSQDEIIEWFQKRKLPKYDRQIRHIAEDGWYIVGGNTRITRYLIDKTLKRDQILLKTIKQANPRWMAGNTKRKNFLDAADWSEILENFKDRGCAVCGLHHENYDRGHLLNGAFDSYNENNIVPMCSSCNNWAQRYNLQFKLDKELRARRILKNCK